MFSLAVASTTLCFGRLIDIYSGRHFYIFGSVWLAIWSLILGFIKNEIMLNLARAFQGVGASAMLPSGLMLMGTIYRPGTRKNITFSVYGACAPLGFFLSMYYMLPVCVNYSLLHRHLSCWYFWRISHLELLLLGWSSLNSFYQYCCLLYCPWMQGSSNKDHAARGPI